MNPDASNLPGSPFLVCEQCAQPAPDGEHPCGHDAQSVRVCLTWATAGECRCSTAFHDTYRVTSSRIPWLAFLVEAHIIQARGEEDARLA